MAAVLTLQALHDYSDRETAEAVRFDVRWKTAIGAPLDDPGFDPSSLVYWRKRLAKPERPHRVNDAVKTVIEQTGILRGRRRRAVDSTILAGAVATQDTVTQLVSAIRRVRREVPGAAEQIAAACTGHDYCQPGKPKIDWDDPEAKDALVSVLVNDANALVAALEGRELDERGASALALLALAAGQDAGPAGGSDGTGGRWRIARKVTEDRVISTVDPDARHTRKSPEARRDGYRAHVAAGPETGIITDEKLTGAAGQENGDPAVAAEFLAAEAAGAGHSGAAEAAGDSQDTIDGRDSDQPLAWYGDPAYGTGDLRAAVAAAGHQAVIKPKPVQPAVPGGFTADDFTVAEQAGTVTCPAGITRQVTARNAVIFGAACRTCPLHGKCTTAKDGRTLHLHEHDSLLRAARADWARRPWTAPGLHDTPARRRARHRPGRHLAGTPAQAPLPRGTRKPRLAQAPHRSAEPAQPARPRPGPPRRYLGAGHLTSRPAAMASAPGKTRPPARQATTPSLTGCRPDQRAGHGRTAAHRRVMNAHQKRPNSAGS